MTIQFDGNIYQVLEFQHVKPGKGPAFVRSKLKNLRTGAIIDHTFNAGIKVEQAHIDKNKMQYLYANGESRVFMNMENYEQVEINESQIKDEIKYLKEGMECDIMFYGTEMLGVDLPEKLEVEVTRTEPGVKGNTTSTAMKDAEVETGYTLKVPMFIEQGETIIINTKTGKYISRK